MTGISRIDSDYISSLRGIAIFIIVAGHLGAFWLFAPWSEFLHFVGPLLFFLSGGLSYYSYKRSGSIKSYYRKRFVGLLVPYYLFCLTFVLGTYIVVNGGLPAMNADQLLRWILVSPGPEEWPFILGQVWFYSALLFMVAISPLYFYLYQRRPVLLVVLVAATLCLAAGGLFGRVDRAFAIHWLRFYPALIHGIFFLFGAVFYASSWWRDPRRLGLLAAAGLAGLVTLTAGMGVDLNWAAHHYVPDLFVIFAGFAALAFILLLQRPLGWLITDVHLIRQPLRFLDKHIYSISLIHSLGILVAEDWLGLNDPGGQPLQYAVLKLTVVLGLSCVLAHFFTPLSKSVTRQVLAWLESGWPVARKAGVGTRSAEGAANLSRGG